MKAMEKNAHRRERKEERLTFNVQRSMLGATEHQAEIETSAPLRLMSRNWIFRSACIGSLLFTGMLLVLLPGAFSQPVHPFQRLPKDESLQPLPQGNAGIIDFIGAHS